MKGPLCLRKGWNPFQFYLDLRIPPHPKGHGVMAEGLAMSHALIWVVVTLVCAYIKSPS